MRGRHTWRPGSKVAIGRVIFFVGALAIAGTIAVLQDTDEGGCVPAEFPNKWLESQEAAGGHTIARHVGKDDAWLTERMASRASARVEKLLAAGIRGSRASR